MRRLLIYDSEITGHHSDYLRAVHDYVESNLEKPGDLQVLFMVPAAMQKMLGVKRSDSAIEFRILTEEELAQIGQTNKRQRSYHELELIAMVAKQRNIDEVFLMSLDYFQAALASTTGRAMGCRVSGILFQPYTRFEKVATEHRFLPGEYFRSLRKRFRLTALLRNSLIDRLCIPCDQSAVDVLVARHGSKVQFDMLPEPYFAGQANPTQSLNIRQRYGIASDDRIILVFGHIIARKNIPNLLRALNSSKLTFKGGVTLLIIGNASETYRHTLEQELEQFRQTAQSISRVVFDCSYADAATMDAAFAQTDIVAMPYFKAYQSSGILFLAARHRKPVITANVGLMNELVQQYSLGETADPQNADDIASALDTLLQKKWHLDTDNEFFQQHTPAKHAACVLGV